MILKMANSPFFGLAGTGSDSILGKYPILSRQ
jgi:hypothetical protein